MIESAFFYNQLTAHGVRFFAGVPDSLLKSFCAYISDHSDKKSHIVAVNEGAAVALASGYHLATSGIPLVYMQNSGIGNAVNPLLSLADFDVYRIPLVLAVGWRGEPGTHDEPQHVTQGKATCSLLEATGIPYAILSGTEGEAERQIAECFSVIEKTGAPYAFVVRRDTFAPYVLQRVLPDLADAAMTREEAIEEIILASGQYGVIVSTTGMASRELYELREKHGMTHERDFLTVGSMGHASSIALGIALQKSDLRVVCLDGDGAALMHLGAIAAIGVQHPQNLCHIVLNNGAHDSVGGQPTIMTGVDLCTVARASGYIAAYSATTRESLRAALNTADTGGKSGAVFIEARVKKGARKDLGRPKSAPPENKAALMEYIAGR
jgi:phosphonopyruvate decarboxylase